MAAEAPRTHEGRVALVTGGGRGIGAAAAATPPGRAGEPEAARAVRCLSGPDAASVTGAIPDVSGGWMMS